MDDPRPPQPESEVFPPSPTARAVTLEELYVQAGDLPQIRRAERSWISSLAMVVVASAAVASFLEVLGYW